MENPNRAVRSSRMSRLGLFALSLALTACATGGDCNSPYAASPQFKDCLFANPPNPQTPPSASTWKNWTRFLFAGKVGTVPLDPIPVRPLKTADLERVRRQLAGRAHDA